MTDIFRGATAVRQAVADYLSVAVPIVAAQARDDWMMTEIQLPDVVKYDAYEPYALDMWPLIGINVTNANDFIRVDIDDDGGNQYLAKYNVRVFTWIRTPMDADDTPLEPEYSESLRLRDDLAAVVRAALLKTGSLGQRAIIFDETTLTEDYSEATKVKGDRWVAGTIHSFTIRLDESVPLVPLGTANTITIVGLISTDLEVGS